MNPLEGVVWLEFLDDETVVVHHPHGMHVTEELTESVTLHIRAKEQ